MPEPLLATEKATQRRMNLTPPPLFSNGFLPRPWVRQMLGYSKDELDLIDTRKFWHDLDQRARITEILRERGGRRKSLLHR